MVFVMRQLGRLSWLEKNLGALDACECEEHDMLKKLMTKSLIVALLLTGLGWFSASEAKAGYWPDEPVLTVAGPDGETYGLFICQRRFLSAECKPGEHKWEPIDP